MGNRAELLGAGTLKLDREILNCYMYWGAIAHPWVGQTRIEQTTCCSRSPIHNNTFSVSHVGSSYMPRSTI